MSYFMTAEKKVQTLAVAMAGIHRVAEGGVPASLGDKLEEAYLLLADCARELGKQG